MAAAAAPDGDPTGGAALQLTVDGRPVTVPDDGGSLLDVLRGRLGVTSAKDGCSPQGQCGCCTVLVDGQPRAACVTAARRVAGRQVTTLDGLDPEVRARWVQAFVDHGASQCGFCTPGILVRLVGMVEGRPAADRAAVERALAAHLCRCTGWRTIVDAALDAAARGTAGPGGTPPAARAALGPGRDPAAAAARAALEGGVPQAVGPQVVLGHGGFADDTAPDGALAAVPDGRGGWATGASVAEARRAAGRTPGRNSTLPLRHPLAVPPGDWALTWQTTFVEPAYLEPDASWCAPDGEPASPLANGGAFGGKLDSPAPEDARRLAGEAGRPVRVVLSREDVVRLGAKRPPVAAGVAADGTGIVRVARTPGSDLDGWAEGLAVAAPGLRVEVVDVPGPPVSARLRAAGWAEGAILAAAAGLVAAGQPVGAQRQPGTPRSGEPGTARSGEPGTARSGEPGTAAPATVTVRAPGGGVATATVAPEGAVAVAVEAGDPLDEVVLRSYAIGAAHQALGWVWREGLAVDEAGEVHDLTIRSFGVLPARDTPAIDVTIVPGGPPTPVGDAVLAAVATAAWAVAGFPARWPLQRS